MRTKPLLLFCAIAGIAFQAFGESAIERQIVKIPEAAGSNQTFAAYATVSITKPSPGQYDYASVLKDWQTNGTGWGTSAEYRRKIRRKNYGGILYSDTPTNSTLYESGQKPFSWPIHRSEFDLLLTHEFAPVHHRIIPYVTSGAGVMVFDGNLGSITSGWNAQAAFVAGAGSDVRLSRLIVMRAGFTVDMFKASTYSDVFYHSTATVMVEPRIGFVWAFGLPHPH
jgi:hypothetical protein